MYKKQASKLIKVKYFSFLPFLLISLLFPSLLFAESKPLSSQAKAIKQDIILIFEDVLDQRSALAQTPRLQTLNDMQSIKKHNQEREEKTLAYHQTLFNKFKSRIYSLSNSNEKRLLTIFLERSIINLASLPSSEADYNTIKRHLNELNNLSKSSLKDNSLLYNLQGDTYSFIMQYEGGASFLRNGPRASKAYKKAFALDPQNYSALIGISTGDLFSPKIAGGNVDRAIRNFTLISQASPFKSERYFSLLFLGLAYEKTKEREKAVSSLKNADAIFPGLLAGKLLRVIEIGESPSEFLKED